MSKHGPHHKAVHTCLKAHEIVPEVHKVVEKLMRLKLMKISVTGAFHTHIQPAALAVIAPTL